MKPKNSSKQIFIENHHEAIISREIFETANRLLEQRAAEKGILKGQGKYQARYPFSGIIVCGECGGTFKRRIHDHGSEIAWACTTHIDDIQKCSMKYVRDDALKATITTMMNKLIFGRKIILVPYIAGLKRCNANSEEIQKFEGRTCQRNQRKLMFYGIFLADKIIKPAMFIQDQNASNKRSEELRRQITQLSQIDTGNSEMVAETEKLLHFLDSAEMQTEFKDFFATDFIEKIIVYDRHSIGIQLKCGLTLKEALL
ncbi:recombinase zinc beta ribbon domain-containing protein [Ruminococcus sp.]|uniref:recombinase zinc beta ribbon domain-containing protein n=1 Tax=Ruminococcus sp. TaxID=41978 RepID=UPI0039941ACB